uniref:G-protein coupled receptors family 1 profile domain-containing protein n=1 Tax=Saimiri boliviensis boliviensis TaxID=39432 RepID=A0A2K6SQK6_SAIBB
ELENQTKITEFFLQGLSEKPEHQTLLFTMFLSTYLVTIIQNVLVILAILTDFCLHTPMCFFLSNLSLVDILRSSTTVPKMLVNIHQDSEQSHPLSGLPHPDVRLPPSLVHTCLMVQLTFCAGSEFSHFFCDLMPLLKLSCSDTHTKELVILASGVVTVFKIPSARGKWKALPTCGSHLTVVSLCYGTIFAVYLQPASPSSSQDKASALMCGVVIPMLSPLSTQSDRPPVLGQNSYWMLIMFQDHCWVLGTQRASHPLAGNTDME